MRQTMIRVAVVLGLLGAGWSIGRAQSADPQVELIVRAPAGETTIECVRGCTLAWVERGVNPAARPMNTFSFACSGPDVSRCSSGRVGAWVTAREP